MKEISINARRLRKSIGLSQSAVAAKAGISRLSYVNIESGKSIPKSDTLLAISQALEVGIFDLIRPSPTFQSLRFRSRVVPNARQRALKEQELVALAEWLKSYAELESLLGDSRQYAFSESSPSNLVEAAGYARKQLGILDDSPIGNLQALISDAGIKLYFLDAKIPGFSGASIGQEDSGPCIAVNRHGMSVERQIFTAAHELGHLLLHRSSYSVKQSNEPIVDAKQEQEADVFASHLLIPADSFLKRWDEELGLHWIDRVLSLKRYFRVSYQVILFRLKEQQAARTDLHKEFAIGFQQRYHHDLKNHFEPDALADSMPFREPEGLRNLDFCEERFSRLIRAALEKSEISISRAAQLSRLSLDDMRNLRQSWLEEP
jgi:Zn-dependent peptidase ImmA (M78 family)/DNA-binding XRE family transcriptional regulator